MKKNADTVYYKNLGKTDFYDCWQLQKKIHEYKQKNDCEDIILLTEHNHVFTLGKSGDKNHLLRGTDVLKQNNISYYEIDRGGDLTYHGPGQLVCYPVFDLNHYYKDTHKFLRNLEEAAILTLKDFGISSHRDEGYTGVWVGEEKICAIGIKISRWITMHGLALNINNELNYFDMIIPCGIFHKGVTSMKKLTGKRWEPGIISQKLLFHFNNIFGINIQLIHSSVLEKYHV